jgi:hypothetical protein
VTGDTLIAEGYRHARPCIHLRPEGDPAALAAVWRGPGVVPARSPGADHWLTVDCRFFATLPARVAPATGYFSVYTRGAAAFGEVAHDPVARLTAAPGGRPLYAHPAVLLPPLEDVLGCGSPAVRAWLAQLGWKPEWGWKADFPDPVVASAYRAAERARLPTDDGGVFAVIGGWPVPWPGDGREGILDWPLVLQTLAESPPWVTVVSLGDGFWVFQRSAA